MLTQPNTHPPLTLGTHLRLLRTRCRLSQLEAARRSGTTQPQISGWENDSTQPSIKQLMALCRVYDAGPADLIGCLVAAGEETP